MALKFARSAAEQAKRELGITVERTGRTIAVAAIGRIDLATERPWHDALMASCTTEADTKRVIVDLTQVTYLSWASTSVLLRAHRACLRRQRTLQVLACGPVLTGLQLTQLDEEITVTPTQRPTQHPLPSGTTGWLIA